MKEFPCPFMTVLAPISGQPSVITSAPMDCLYTNRPDSFPDTPDDIESLFDFCTDHATGRFTILDGVYCEPCKASMVKVEISHVSSYLRFPEVINSSLSPRIEVRATLANQTYQQLEYCDDFPRLLDKIIDDQTHSRHSNVYKDDTYPLIPCTMRMKLSPSNCEIINFVIRTLESYVHPIHFMGSDYIAANGDHVLFTPGDPSSQRLTSNEMKSLTFAKTVGIHIQTPTDMSLLVGCMVAKVISSSEKSNIGVICVPSHAQEQWVDGIRALLSIDVMLYTDFESKSDPTHSNPTILVVSRKRLQSVLKTVPLVACMAIVDAQSWNTNAQYHRALLNNNIEVIVPLTTAFSSNVYNTVDQAMYPGTVSDYLYVFMIKHLAAFQISTDAIDISNVQVPMSRQEQQLRDAFNKVISNNAHQMTTRQQAYASKIICMLSQGRVMDGESTLGAFTRRIVGGRYNTSTSLRSDAGNSIQVMECKFPGCTISQNESDCTVCFETFDRKRFQEKIIPCGHVLCFSCIQDLVQRSSGKNTLECPQCSLLHECPVEIYDRCTSNDVAKATISMSNLFTKGTEVTKWVRSHTKDVPLVIYIEGNATFYENIITADGTTCTTSHVRGQSVTRRTQELRQNNANVVLMVKHTDQFVLSRTESLLIVHPPTDPYVANQLLNASAHCQVRRLVYENMVDEFVTYPYGQLVNLKSKRFYTLYTYFVNKHGWLKPVDEFIKVLQIHYQNYIIGAFKNRVTFSSGEEQFMIKLQIADACGSIIHNGVSTTRENVLAELRPMDVKRVDSAAPVVDPSPSDEAIIRRQEDQIMKMRKQLLQLEQQAVCFIIFVFSFQVTELLYFPTGQHGTRVRTFNY